MTPIKTTVIPILPSTHVRSTQGDRWLFKVSDEYLLEYDNKRVLEGGKVGGNRRRKAQLEKYNAYKQEIRWWAAKNNFTMPVGYFALWFYVPMPKSWRKKKRAEMLYMPHDNTPDWDNFIKALFDSLMPRKSKTKGEKGSDDRRIHCGAVFKIWVSDDECCIKILEYNKNDFEKVFIDGHPKKVADL